MSTRKDAYYVTLTAMKGHRVDTRWQVASEVVDALVDAGIIPSEQHEMYDALASHPWEYGFYDSDDPGTPPHISAACYGLPFLTPEDAKRVGDKNVFSKTVIVRRHPASPWEPAPEPDANR